MSIIATLSQSNAGPGAPCIFASMHTALVFGLVASAALGVAASATEDPFIWLEDAHGARAMAWVEAENAKTTAVIESDPRFETLYNDAKSIAEAKDRIPEPNILGGA